MKRYNYKLIIGFILGIILFGGVVYSEILYNSNIVHYDNSNGTLTSSNVQAAIDELATRYAAVSSCPSDKICFAKKSTLALGDYISYTPSKTSYTTDTSMTGSASTQTIKPSELNLWRVISINGNGTVDIISEHVSSTAVSFRGQTGYQNFVGYLNVLAKQYETTGVTVGSRHFGYNGQTEYITDTTYFVNPAPWTCSTGSTSSSCNPKPQDYEAYGGGDTLYQSDYDLINTVLGTRVATNPSGTATLYWMASRYYSYSGSSYYYWNGRFVITSGSFGNGRLYSYNSSSFYTNNISSALRPIVTLKSGLSYYGLGNEDYPMEIQ